MQYQYSTRKRSWSRSSKQIAFFRRIRKQSIRLCWVFCRRWINVFHTWTKPYLPSSALARQLKKVGSVEGQIISETDSTITLILGAVPQQSNCLISITILLPASVNSYSYENFPFNLLRNSLSVEKNSQPNNSTLRKYHIIRCISTTIFLVCLF